MKRLRLSLSVCVCKLAILASRLLGKKGTSMPGHLAFKIYPGVLKDLASQVKREIIVSTGTNGKTTTNNLLYSYLTGSGNRVVGNLVGANMFYGICCAFCEKANIFGKLNVDFACLEVDEASTVKVLSHIKPHKMIITNLFRDQMDRYGEIEMTVDYIKRALAQSPDTELILNGDDPIVSQFGEDKSRKSYYVSVDENTGAGADSAQEGQFCMLCGERLCYEYYHYSQLGKFLCPGCGFKRKESEFKINSVSITDGLKFDISYNGEIIPFDVNYRGFYNVYNIAMSYAAARLSYGEIPCYQEILASYRPQIGRMEEFNIGRSVVLNLAKNPAGFNQAIQTVMQDEKKKDILLAVNDNESDGIDISWFYDVDFEKFLSDKVGRIIVSGFRADDLALRLKYAGIRPESITKTYDLKDAAKKLLSGSGEICYALVNYTVVFRMQEILKEMEAAQNE